MSLIKIKHSQNPVILIVAAIKKKGPYEGLTLIRPEVHYPHLRKWNLGNQQNIANNVI